MPDSERFSYPAPRGPAACRKAQLEAVEALFIENHDELCEALRKDLRRNVTDADLMDMEYCRIDEWVKSERAHYAARVRARPYPHPPRSVWGGVDHRRMEQKPFMLTFGPLTAALAGGNTAVIEPSEVSVASSAAAARLALKYFDPRAVAVVEGAVPETTALLAQKWDFIFLTRGPPVGKIVHQAAAKNLTPCVLELGGKNPTIVHSSADLKAAAPRIAYGRFSNSGHICTAPDHVLVWPEVKHEFLRHLTETIREFYGDDPKASPYYGRVINRRNFDRLVGLLGSGKTVAGGQSDASHLYIAPTVLADVSPDSPIMQEEVFGPILPVLEIESVEAVIEWVNNRPSPLGLYVFTEDLDVAERILEATEFGDAEVNDCAIHPLVSEFPFDGVGNSGMGKYHGHWGFEAFTNARGIMYHSAKVDPGVRYPPCSKDKFERKIETKLMPYRFVAGFCDCDHLPAARGVPCRAYSLWEQQRDD